MFKLLPLLFAYILCSVASPHPEALYNVINSRADAKVVNNPTAQQLQSNDATLGAQADINGAAHALVGQTSVARASAASAPASISRLSAAASVGSSAASSSASRSSLRASSSARVPSGNSITATVQHHILPAETIPLPITISTRPGLRTVIAPETITIRRPAVAKVGEVVQQIPSAVSRQDQTVVHKHARVVTPIVAPAVRTMTSHVLRAYHTPLVFNPQTAIVDA